MPKQAISIFCIVAITIGFTGCAVDNIHNVNDADSYAGYVDNNVNPVVRDAMSALVADNPEHASELLNAALGEYPRDPLLNLLNGMAYHALAAGEGNDWDLAQVGYQLAHQFDPYLWQAPYLLGVMHLKERNLPAAAIGFSKAILASPHNPAPLYGLAATSYAMGDLNTAYQAVKLAGHLATGTALQPFEHHIAALSFAAVGLFAEAATEIAALKANGVSAPEVQWLERKVSAWQTFHTNLQNLPLLQSASTSASSAGAGGATTPPASLRMAILEAIIVRTETANKETRGINLLGTLSAQFQGVLLNPSRTRIENNLTGTLKQDDTTWISNLQLSIPAVTYSLNIANNTDTFSRIDANPSVLVLDGKESKFFLGNNISVFTTGSWSSLATKDIGLSITVTPTFITDDVVQVAVATDFATLQGSTPTGQTTSSMLTIPIDKTTSTTSAVMKFGETMVVSAGTIRQEIKNLSGVPILDRIPFIDNLFSNRSLGINKGSLLVLLTLKPNTVHDTTASAPSPLLAHNETFTQVRQRFESITPQLQATLEQLQHHDLFTIIRPDDIAPINPLQFGRQDDLARQWRQQFLNELVAM